MKLWNQHFTSKGRLNRKQYWLILVPCWFIMFSIKSVYEHDLLPNLEDSVIRFTLVLFVLFIAFAFAFSIYLVTAAKRWHDRDKSAWWILINLIPIIGPLWTIIETGFLAGTIGDNRYGDDPLNPQPVNITINP